MIPNSKINGSVGEVFEEESGDVPNALFVHVHSVGPDSVGLEITGYDNVVDLK